MLNDSRARHTAPERAAYYTLPQTQILTGGTSLPNAKSIALQYRGVSVPKMSEVLFALEKADSNGTRMVGLFNSPASTSSTVSATSPEDFTSLDIDSSRDIFSTQDAPDQGDDDGDDDPLSDCTSACKSSGDLAACPRFISACETSVDDSQRSVRFADEEGRDLVSHVHTVVDWWEAMVFGGITRRPEAEGMEETPTCVHCGYVQTPGTGQQGSCAACGNGGGSVRNSHVGELYLFVEELTGGVEAVLVFPGLLGTKKRRHVILYTDDNGKSLCWMETVHQQSRQKPQVPYRLACKCLLEVKDKTGVASISSDLSSSNLTVDSNNCFNHIDSDARGAWGCDADGSYGGSETELGQEGVRVCDGSGGADDGGSGFREIQVRLKWRIKPTFPVRKVTIGQVKTWNPAAFVRGLLRLSEHNFELSRS